MLMNMYVIRDTLAEESSAPMLAKNDGVASVMAARSIEALPFDARASYLLLHVGTFDTEATIIMVMPNREVPIALIGKDEKDE